MNIILKISNLICNHSTISETHLEHLQVKYVLNKKKSSCKMKVYTCFEAFLKHFLVTGNITNVHKIFSKNIIKRYCIKIISYKALKSCIDINIFTSHFKLC